MADQYFGPTYPRKPLCRYCSHRNTESEVRIEPHSRPVKEGRGRESCPGSGEMAESGPRAFTRGVETGEGES
jgi:hypothetical protein